MAKQSRSNEKPKAKTKPKRKAKATEVVPERWVCTENWLRNVMGRDFRKGDDLLIHPSQITDAVMETLQNSFEKVAMKATTVVSENIKELESEEVS